jgi:hypothetical protein
LYQLVEGRFFGTPPLSSCSRSTSCRRRDGRRAASPCQPPAARRGRAHHGHPAHQVLRARRFRAHGHAPGRRQEMAARRARSLNRAESPDRWECPPPPVHGLFAAPPISIVPAPPLLEMRDRLCCRRWSQRCRPEPMIHRGPLAASVARHRRRRRSYNVSK